MLLINLGLYQPIIIPLSKDGVVSNVKRRLYCVSNGRALTIINVVIRLGLYIEVNGLASKKTDAPELCS